MGRSVEAMKDNKINYYPWSQAQLFEVLRTLNIWIGRFRAQGQPALYGPGFSWGDVDDVGLERLAEERKLEDLRRGSREDEADSLGDPIERDELYGVPVHDEEDNRALDGEESGPSRGNNGDELPQATIGRGEELSWVKLISDEEKARINRQNNHHEMDVSDAGSAYLFEDIDDLEPHDHSHPEAYAKYCYHCLACRREMAQANAMFFREHGGPPPLRTRRGKEVLRGDR